MRACKIKSVGTLVDELGTLDLKIKAGIQGAEERRHELGNAIIEDSAILIVENNMPAYREFQRITQELNDVLALCWIAQEIVGDLPEPNECTMDQLLTLGAAAKEAQHTNAARNRLIRRLDELVNDTEHTQLTKSYDKDKR